jgi:hypothetical protein
MKKKMLLSVLILATVSTVNAQNYKWWAGGKSHFWRTEYHTDMGVAPEIGYHITPKLTIASSVGLYSHLNHSEGAGFNYNYIILNPYMRYNAILSGNLLFFVDGGIDCKIGRGDAFQIGFKPGMAIFLSDRVTLALQFGFIGYNDGNGIGVRKDRGVGFDLSGYQSGFALFYSF